MENRTIRWGIVGTGHAREFAKGLGALPNARLVAVASRTQEKADAFGREFGAGACYASVAALAADPEVDVVYVGSSPLHHAEHARACLAGGKGVLVEKPFTIDAAEAVAVQELARAKGLFCMEALWSRFLPATRDVAGWLAQGRIGQVRQVIADFGFCAEWDPKARYFDPGQRGGSLLDVGVYSLAFAALALGETPCGIAAQATLCPTGVDEQAAMVLGYAGGGLAVLSCANRTRLPHRGCIVGTEGRIEVEGFVWAHGATLRRDGEAPLVVEPKLPLPAYSYQATETMRCLAVGLTESPLLPMSEVVARMRILDEVRRQIGVVYPVAASLPTAV
jgi:predicted dehydrogenase